MNFNLKQTKTTDAETIEHLLTVLQGYLQEMEYSKIPMKEWTKAKQYLTDYMAIWREQNK